MSQKEGMFRLERELRARAHALHFGGPNLAFGEGGVIYGLGKT